MKAAPEKIYMTPSFGEPDNVLLASFSKSHLNFHRDIEYTRTDAFIKKAVSYLEGTLFNEVCYGEIRPDIVQAYIDDFKKAMKDE